MFILRKTNFHSIQFSYFLVIFLLINQSCKQGSPSANSIVIGEKITLSSKILNEDRTIFIHVPEAIDESSLSKYPVLFVTDGESLFDLACSTVDFLSSIKGNDLIPPMIIVGIPNINRNRDFVPFEIEAIMDSGGGEKFAQFFKTELIPFIDKNYPTLPNRSIIGHSYGGLWATYMLAEHPELFDQYIALDPSIRHIPEQLNNILNRSNQGEAIYIGIANTFPTGKDTTDLRGDVSDDLDHINVLFNFQKNVSQCEDCQLAFYAEYFPEESHGSLVVLAMHNALRQLFSWYHFDLDPYYFSDRDALPKDILKKLKDHYTLISSKMGESIVPPELLVNKLSGIYRSRKNTELSLELLEFNLKNHPKSFDTRVMLGMHYQMIGNNKEAIAYWEAALELRPSPQVAQMIEDLNQ